MRRVLPQRIALGVAALAMAVTAVLAGGAVQGTSEDVVVGSKAEQPAVPGLTPWGAVVMALMMLTTSSFAFYAGSLARLKDKVVTRGVDRPSAEEQQTPAKPRRQAPQWSSVPQRQSQLYRQRRTNRRPHAATSQSKKRRVGPGCRGPLRKT